MQPSLRLPRPLSDVTFVKQWAKRMAGAAALRAGAYRALLGKTGVIVAFHRIDDRYPGNAVTIGEGDFAEFCRFFKKTFDVVPLKEIVADVTQGASVAGKLAITFDDGYLCNYRLAAPILTELELPASFFVTTGFLGTRRVPHWDAEWGIRSEWMSWDHVRELHGLGFEIGAHTINHVDLSKVHGEAARREIQGSRCVLQDKLGTKIDLFAYPYGGPEEVTEENRSMIKELGFLCCPSCYGGRVRPGDDPFELRRAPITNWYRSPSHFALEILRD